MAAVVTHTYVDPIADDPADALAGKVLPSHWNASHTITGLAAIAASGSASDLSAGTVPDARMPDLTGDITTVEGAVATTLATVNGNVGTFGSATKASVVTVTAKGLVTAASETTVTPAVGSITGLAANVATFLATPSSANLAAALTDETGTGLAVFGTAPTFASTMTVGTASGTTGAIALKGTTSGTVTLTVAAAAGTTTFKLPTADGSNGDMVTTNGSGQLAFTTPGVGSAGDMLSVLTNTPVSVTADATATISKMHYCAPTSANITLTLPAVSGNDKKHIGVVILPTATKLVTVDGAGGESVGGVANRVMWAGEAAILECRESANDWVKIAGCSVPMETRLVRSTDQSYSTATWTAITMTAQSFGLQAMFDNVNGRISIQRDGRYLVFSTAYCSAAAAMTFAYISAGISGTNLNWYQQSSGIGGTAAGSFSMELDLVASNYVDLFVYSDGTSPKILGAGGATCGVVEIPRW